MERRDLFAVTLGQICHNLTERSVVDIHIIHIDDPGQIIFFTQLPCLLRTDFHTGFTGYHNDSGSRCVHCLFHFAHKVKISRRI